ncbi:MAG TPA: HEAT repeat domain-containing protein, partial [Pyrinomonadaceae bacterium]|nr:HEAT repeat domain-containing protein [Pyrinomonadaceae bacterium]
MTRTQHAARLVRPRTLRALFARCAASFCLFLLLAPASAARHAGPQDAASLTPLQLEIEKQRARLSSPEQEERRDAVQRLGALSRPDASRAASAALRDTSAVVRATAARAVVSLGPEDAAALLLPLL